MKVNKLYLFDGAAHSSGLTVIIDVFRAFSLEAYLLGAGAEKIIAVETTKQAFDIKRDHPEYLLAGERNEKKVAGFTMGNSPWESRNHNVSGKTVIHTSSSGTKGLALATNAEALLAGSFVTAGATAKYIKNRKPNVVSLVSMGYAGQYRTEEDDFCADYFANELKDEPTNYEQMVETIKKTSGLRFFDPDRAAYCPMEDFYQCLRLNRFNFTLIVQRNSDKSFTISKSQP
jgi:2-phosphosulfolactate phosphatase